jgi:hypothetical protein
MTIPFVPTWGTWREDDPGTLRFLPDNPISVRGKPARVDLK